MVRLKLIKIMIRIFCVFSTILGTRSFERYTDIKYFLQLTKTFIHITEMSEFDISACVRLWDGET